MDFRQAVETGLKKYAVFEGRASRSEFWWFILAYVLAVVVVSLIDGVAGGTGSILALFILGLLLPMLGIQIRRLHDIGRSGWWYLVSLIPLVGSVVLLVWCCQRGDAGPNKFGPEPNGATPERAVRARPVKQRDGDLARLEKLHELFERGVITKEEFESQKASLLG